MVEDSEENEERIPEESHNGDDKDEDDENDEEEGDEEENDLKEKLYRELKEREQAMREPEESEQQDDGRQGGEEDDEGPEREKALFNDLHDRLKHYDDDDDNYGDAEGRKRYQLNRVISLSSKGKLSSHKHSDNKKSREFSVEHAERLLDHLQDEALDNQKKLNFQQTSGRITNKGLVTIGDINNNDKESRNGKMKRVNRKSKRQELFLAPHRRNYSKRNNNSEHSTVEYLIYQDKHARNRNKQNSRNNSSNTQSSKRNTSNAQSSSKYISPSTYEENNAGIRSIVTLNNSTRDSRRQELVFQTFFFSKSKVPKHTFVKTYVLKESVYIYGVCQQMLSSHFNSLTHRCIKRICLYIWCLSTNVIKSLQLAYA